MCDGFGGWITPEGEIYFIEPDDDGDVSHAEILERLDKHRLRGGLKGRWSGYLCSSVCPLKKFILEKCGVKPWGEFGNYTAGNYTAWSAFEFPDWTEESFRWVIERTWLTGWHKEKIIRVFRKVKPIVDTFFHDRKMNASKSGVWDIRPLEERKEGKILIRKLKKLEGYVECIKG